MCILKVLRAVSQSKISANEIIASIHSGAVMLSYTCPHKHCKHNSENITG